MPRLSDVFQRMMQPGSLGGHQVTRAELADAIRQSTDAELKTFAAQALDSIADGELVRMVVDRIGPDSIPPPTNSLTVNRASSQLLRGERSVRQGDQSAAGKQAIRTLQRALVKIAAHHPDGQALTELLQLPWAADGSIGEKTIDALNVALRMDGQLEGNLTEESAIGKAEAEAIERLLRGSARIVHPANINTPRPAGVKKAIVFVGMGDHAHHEAAWVKKTLGRGYEMRFVGDSKVGDDQIKVKVAGRDTIFDLREAGGRRMFVDTGFTPKLTEDQKTSVLKALELQEWGMSDARDEIALMALEFHRANCSNGKIEMTMFYGSGHSGGGPFWGDNNGSMKMGSIQAVAEAFPNAAGTVLAPYFSACNHLHPKNVRELQDLFPNMEHAGGYSAYSPGTWTGAIAHCITWSELTQEGHDTITHELYFAKLKDVFRRAGGDRDDPRFYANEKRFNVALWNKSDGLYRWYEKEGDDYIGHTAAMQPDRAVIDERVGVVEELRPRFDAMIAGEPGAPELRDIRPGPMTIAKEMYNGATKLKGTMGLDDAQTALAEKYWRLGISARYYDKILKKFTGENAGVIREANRELGAIGFDGMSEAALKATETTRRMMLDYIETLAGKVADLQAGGHACQNAKALLGSLQTQIRDFMQIPETWL